LYQSIIFLEANLVCCASIESTTEGIPMVDSIEDLKPGTVVVAGEGKAEQRCQITQWHPGINGGWYAAQRWINKTGKWSGIAYVLLPQEIVCIEPDSESNVDASECSRGALVE